MKTHINLLSRENRRRLMLRGRLLQWLTVWCLTTVVAFALGWSGYREHLLAQGECDRNARLYEPVKVLREELTIIQTQVDTLMQQEKMVEELVDLHPAITLFGVVGLATKQCHGRLHIGIMKVGKSGGKGMASSGSTPGKSQVVVIQGTSLDIASVIHFVDILRKSSIFTQVDMKPTKESKLGDLMAFAYDVECVY